jgi:flavin reductase ActVB
MREVVAFKEAMASFPSGVTIVTTADREGRWRGFTATSFCSVSLDPPLVLVCLATTAECHSAFRQTDRWAVHVIPPEQAELALRFATRGADKFGSGVFVPDERGVPILTTSCVVIHCSTHAQLDGGDHTILIGRVERAEANEILPVVYFRQSFHALSVTNSSP